jgi:sugar phosphate isomerase/epimerase
VPIGEGGYIDFPGQFKALQDMGYEGACSLETHWRPASELSTELMNKPGGAAFSEGGEEASRICLENITRILQDLGAI